MDREDSESTNTSQQTTISMKRTSDFSIESLLRKDPEPLGLDRGHCGRVEFTTEDDEDLRIPCYSQIGGSNYDSDQEVSTSSSPELMNPILEGKDNPQYLRLIENNLSTFSWLACTRFKPPKLPRSKKRAGCKRYGRGPRIPFAPHQIAVLESTFSKSQYLSSDCIHSLADTLHLSETRVKIWFQNRRARYRREKEASNLAQNNGTEGPNFYAQHQHHTSGSSHEIPTRQDVNGTEDTASSISMDIARNVENGNYSNYFQTMKTGTSSAEDLSTSKRRLLMPDFISQQLHHYRQVQEYILHQQDQLRYNPPVTGDSRLNQSPQKQLFSPTSSILHAVLQSSTASSPIVPGIPFPTNTAPKGFPIPTTIECQIPTTNQSNRFPQFTNPYSISPFPMQFR